MFYRYIYCIKIQSFDVLSFADPLASDEASLHCMFCEQQIYYKMKLSLHWIGINGENKGLD